MQRTRKANLFIVGAMKAGTTSFCETLGGHPDIFFAPIKEPNYFLTDLPSHIFKESPFFSIENYFEREFPGPLHIAHLKSSAHYSHLFSLAEDEKYLAEGSTAYLHAPESAALIHQYNPEAKIIILVRDGLKRAFSHYKMDIGLGKTLLSFEEAMLKDFDERQSGIRNNWNYFGMSLYHENIKRFRQYFGNNVLVLNFDELIKNQDREFGKFFNFLDIQKIPLQLAKSNESGNIRFKKALYFLNQSGLKNILSKVLPVNLRHKIFKSILKKEPQKLTINDILRTNLETIFSQDQSKLEAQC